MLRALRKTTDTNFIVFDLIRSGLEPTIYRIRGEHANHYTIDAVFQKNIEIKCLIEQLENILFSILKRLFFNLLKSIKSCLLSSPDPAPRVR